jgi:hypothetical protein
MARNTIDFDVVREVALALPDVEESTTSRGSSLKLHGRILACPATHTSAEPDSLVVRVSLGDRENLLAAEPDTYYLTDHYLNHSVVLVRLAQISRGSLKELLEGAWRLVAT